MIPVRTPSSFAAAIAAVMRPFRTGPSAILLAGVVTLALAALAAPAAPAHADENEKCTVAIKGDSPIAKACQEGGVRLAKRRMKELVRTAREKGMVNECGDCHNRPDNWTLTKGATDKFRRLIDLSQ
jgi:hypothetical protein